MPSSERGNRLKRTLDPWLGLPMVFALSLVRPRKRQPEVVRNIGLLMFAAIGDTILASAIVHDLRAAFPSARITGFVSSANAGVAELLDGFDEIVRVPITRPLSAIAVVRKHDLDVAIDVGQWTRVSALVTSLARSRYAIGFKTPGKHRHLAFDAFAEHSAQRHEIDNFRALTRCLGIESTSMPRLRCELAREKPVFADRSYVVLHPWASGFRSQLREWATPNWLKVARTVIGWGYGVVITGGPADQPRAQQLAAELNRPNDVLVLAGRASLKDTASVLLHAAAVVAVNTGTMHLAALLNRPLVALHGPTNSRRWGPIGDNSVVVGPGPDRGGGYLNLGFEYPRSPIDCMAMIAPEEVITPLGAMLSEFEAQTPYRLPASA